MIEKIGPIKNPLTIIAIFAGISEVCGSIVLPFIQNENQLFFIYFLIAFPSLLVILFFITLNFNNRVLYSPSDYKDEENFLKILRFDFSKLSNTETIFNQSEMTSSLIAEFSENMESLSNRVEAIRIALVEHSELLSQTKELVPTLQDLRNLQRPLLKRGMNFSIKLSNLPKAELFINLLNENGFSAEIYFQSGDYEKEIVDVSDHKSIWLGKRVPLEIAVQVITLSKTFFEYLEYIKLSEDPDLKPPDYVHDQIFIGGATSTAKGMNLKPLSRDDFEHIKEKKTLVELHNFIRSFHS